jgi:hypothetical protein
VGGFLRQLFVRQSPAGWREALKSEAKARTGTVSIANAAGYAVWEEPNRGNAKLLHIGKSGERYSTLTGVWWLDRTTMIVAHRGGLRLGVFDTTQFDRPVWVGEVGHLTDDIAAKPVADGAWEIAVSGCWDCIYSRFTLSRTAGASPTYSLAPIDSRASATRDFCHGVAYSKAGDLNWTISTGAQPRFETGGKVFSLPAPWGARDICDDPARGRQLVVAVSANPKESSYDGVYTTLWSRSAAAEDWTCLAALSGVHSDALDVWGRHIWLTDQLGNRLLALDATSGEVAAVFSGDCLDFPHGIGISPEGRIAVTNYGSSSVVLLDAAVLMA